MYGFAAMVKTGHGLGLPRLFGEGIGDIAEAPMVA